MTVIVCDPLGLQRDRQSARHVGQATCLDQRKDLGRDGQNRDRRHPRSPSIIDGVIRQMPFSERLNRRASSSASSPTTRPGGNAHALLHDHVAQPGAAADIGVRQDQRILHLRVGMHVHAVEQQGAAQECPRNDAAAGHQRGNRLAAPAVLVVHELGRRGDLGIGPDWPVAVVQIERRRHRGQIDIRLKIRIDRPDIPPIQLLLGCGTNA